MMKCCGFLILSCFSFSGAFAQTQTVKSLVAEAAKHNNEPTFVRLLSEADSLAALEHDISTRAMLNEKLGFYFFSRDADKCISHYGTAYKFYEQSGNHKKAAFCKQNTAFAYDEAKHDNIRALQLANEALHLWKLQQDTMQQANIYKYIGLLQGRQGQYTSARENIEKAIALFGSKKFEQGVAVCYFDLADVLLRKKDAAGAIGQLGKAKAIWQQYGDSTRIYVINTALLKSFALTGDRKAATQVLEENLLIEQQTEVFWNNRLEFYREVQNYTVLEDKKQTQAFEIKYRILNDSLKKEGIKTE